MAMVAHHSVAVAAVEEAAGSTTPLITIRIAAAGMTATTTATRTISLPFHHQAGCLHHQAWRASVTACRPRRRACLASAMASRLRLLCTTAEEDTKEVDSSSGDLRRRTAVTVVVDIRADIKGEETSMVEVVDRKMEVVAAEVGTVVGADR